MISNTQFNYTDMEGTAWKASFTGTEERYSKAVEDLKAACAEAGIEVTRTRPHMGGFIVYFAGYDGDAAIHSGTYGHESNCFETYGMPWDHGDVTGWLTVEQLVYALVHGELLDEYEEE